MLAMIDCLNCITAPLPPTNIATYRWLPYSGSLIIISWTADQEEPTNPCRAAEIYSVSLTNSTNVTNETTTSLSRNIRIRPYASYNVCVAATNAVGTAMACDTSMITERGTDKRLTGNACS